jgi:hypothetical protein
VENSTYRSLAAIVTSCPTHNLSKPIDSTVPQFHALKMSTQSTSQAHAGEKKSSISYKTRKKSKMTLIDLKIPKSAEKMNQHEKIYI